MAHANNSSTLHRLFAPLAGSLWILFLLLSVLIAPVWAFDIGEAQIREAIHARELQTALLWLSSVADIGWLAVAAVVVYSSVAKTEGLATARRWAALVLAGSWLIGAFSVWTKWPLGAIHFTGRLGLLIGPVSIGWLLLWCIVILGGRDAVRAVFPHASHIRTALYVALLATATYLNLEPLAFKTRAWWLWMDASPHPGMPTALRSSLTWFLASLALAWCMRSPVITRAGRHRIPGSAGVFVVFQILLLLAHLGKVLRH